MAKPPKQRKLSPMQVLLQSIHDKVHKEISQGCITIPTRKKPLSLHKSLQQPSGEDNQHRLETHFHQLQQKKNVMRAELNILMQEENIIRTKHKAQLQKQHKLPHIRDIVPKDSDDKIKAIRRKERQTRKKWSVESDILAQTQYKNASEVKATRKRELKEIKAKLEAVKQRQKERKQLKEKTDQELENVKHKEYLFKKREAEWHQKQEGEIKELEELIENSKWKKMDHEDLKQHQQLYNEVMKQSKIQREKRLTASRPQDPVKYQCRFLDKIEEEEREKKLKEQQKRQEVLEHLKKQQKFSEKVRSMIKDMKTADPQLLHEGSKNLKKSGLSLHEQYVVGNQYLRSCTKLLHRTKNSEPSNTHSDKKMPNYLQQLHEQRRTVNISGKGNNLKKVLNKQNISAQKKIKMTKEANRKLEAGKKPKVESLIDSLSNKIHLLKALQESN